MQRQGVDYPSVTIRRKTAIFLIILALSFIARMSDGQTLSLPANVIEGSGILTNGGSVILSTPATSNITVTLQSDTTSDLVVPPSVTISTGQSNASFNLTIGDNLIVDGNRQVRVTATPLGFPSLTNVVTVLDNDPDHIRFGAIPSITDTNSGLAVLLRAENADGSLQTNFNLGVTIAANSIEGPLPLTPTNTGNFAQGQKYMGFQILTPGHAVRLQSIEYPGQSDPFTVIPPAFYSSTQAVVDICWVEASKTLLASVSATNSAYPNSLVAIDPNTGAVTNSYPVGLDPSTIQIAPGGGYLYVALSNQTRLQRFDLNTRTAGINFSLGTSTNPYFTAYDFCISPGLSDSVVVMVRSNSFPIGAVRYDSGAATALPNFAAYGWLVENLDTGNDIVISPGLARANAANGAILATNGNFPGQAVTYRGGQLYDDHGNAYAPSTLALLGTYPSVLDQIYNAAFPEVDPVLRRVFYLTGYFNYGASFYQLKVYDRDLRQLLCQLTVPSTSASPTRFLRCGSNALAYVTGNGQLWFIRPDATQPPEPAADLALSLSGVPPVAVLGSNYTFTMTLSNAGPGVASIVQVTNSLPSNATLFQSTPSTGSVAAFNGAFTWTVANLPAGSNAALQVTLRFNTGGWQTNVTTALGFEADPVFVNNITNLPVFVQLAPNAVGAFSVNASCEDLLYDPARDRLLFSVGTGDPSGSTNGLAVYNPYNGLTDSFTTLGKKPSKLARSDDGQFLYVSLPQDALVRRFNLPTLSQNLEFALGGEYINGDYYPWYAYDLAVPPGAPHSVVAWRVRRAGPMASEYGQGIGVFQDGVIGTNVTASGGSWSLEFDRDSGTLFAFNTTVQFTSGAADMRRCAWDTNGVSFVEQFPTFYSAGTDVEYGGHEQMFTTSGRQMQDQPFNLNWLYAGAENATLVEPDAASGRVFYLVQNNGWQIKAYSVSNKTLLGSIPVPNLIGTPTSLIRWSTNGLAFRTTSNQVFIIRSPLVQPTAAADVAVTLTGPSQPVPTNNNAVFTITITNQGPSAASGLQITNSFTTNSSLVTVSASAGTWSTNSGLIVWALTNLDTGAQATLSYTITSSQAGVVTATAMETSATPDAVLGNNTAVSAVVFGSPLAIDSVAMLQLPANDLVWSPSRSKLLLTTSNSLANWAGSLITLDPSALAVQFGAPLGVDASRLAISRDDNILYAGIDSGIGALPISTLAVTNNFLINPFDPRGFAFDLKVVPGSNQVVAVGAHSHSDNSTWLGAYDSGLERSNTDSYYSGGLSIEFGGDPATLYTKDFSGGGFRSYTLNDQGLSLINSDTGILPTYTSMDLFWGNGLLYTSIGKVINPTNNSLVGTIPGIPAGSRVRYEAGANRIFFLCPGVNQAVLMAYDAPSLLFIDSRTIPGVSGALGNFVRWGTNGLALTTSSGQLFVLRSSLIPNPPADVSISLSHSAPPFLAGSNITATITITNAGPNPATDVTWSNAMPAGTIIVSTNASMGTVSVVSNAVTGSIPSLSVGSTATINVTFTSPTVGALINQAKVIATSMDPAFTNNFAVALLWISSPTNAPSSVSLTLPVKDLERDPIRPLLYASFGSTAGILANSVAVIDPLNGGASVPVPVGSNPGKLAASPDGQFLYVALDGSGTVQKLSLPGLQLVSTFAVPNSQTVSRMMVSPTNSDMVVIRRVPDGKLSLHVAGVKMPGELSVQDLFAFSDVTGRLYGCDGFHSNVKLYQLDTTSTGLALLDAQAGKQSQATDLQASGGLLFYNHGMVVNADSAQVQALMPVPVNSVVAPDATSGRVFYLTPLGSVWILRAFDIHQGIEVGSLATPTLTSAPVRLLRWGADGLAYYNTNSQVVILRGQLVPTNPPVDVVMSQSFNMLTATTNDTLTLSLGVTNLGPITASGVVVTQSYSLPVTNVSPSVSTGTATYTNGVLTWTIGSLSTGVVASASVTLRSAQSGTLNSTATAYHNLNDSFWGNNVAIDAVNILNPATSNALQIKIPARDLVYDATRDLIYASTPASNRLGGNLVAVIDPNTGKMKRAFAAGSEPSRLALSDGAASLNVALDGAMGVQQINPSSGAAGLLFSFATNDIYFAQDLVAQPGHPGTVAASVGSYNFVSGFPSDVIIYDSGVARANRGGPARGLTFANDGSQLFGYVSPGSGNGIVRMTPTNSGLVTETVTGFTTAPGDLKFSNGRLYGSSGQVTDPSAGTYIGTFGVSGPQAIDSNIGRAFNLVQRGTNWELRSFDLSTLQPMGTQTVANVQGTPLNLIRCGGDRLAFRTPSNQIFIVHSSLVPTKTIAPADVQLTQQAIQDFTASVETLRFTMFVTNAGPGGASNVLLAIKPPAGVASLTLQLPQGTSTSSGGTYLCNLGSLPAGQSLAVVLSAVITNTAAFSNFASVSASVPDPDLSNNASLTSVQGVYSVRPDAYSTAPISARDLVYDPMRDRLFVGLYASNAVVWLNPETGLVEGSIPVAGTPDHLAISDNSQYLYVCSSTSLVQRIDLGTKAVDFTFNLPVTYLVRSAVVLPGQPHALAVCAFQFDGAFDAIFDDGVARPNQMANSFGLFVPTPDGTILFGYDTSSTGGASPDVYRIAVDASGLSLIDTGPSDTPWGQNANFKYVGGKLYFGNGDVLNPADWSAETPFPRFNYGQWIAVNEAANRAIFVGVPDTTAQMGVYDLATRQQLSLASFPGVNSVSSLTQCGADRFAFRTGDQIVIVRSSTIPAADLSVRGSFSTNQVMAGDTFTLHWAVSNAGPYSASGVTLTNYLPAQLTALSITISQGTFVTNGQTIIASLGTLNSNSVATVDVTLSASTSFDGWLSTSADANAGTPADPAPSNNHNLQQIWVLPLDSDHDGIPDSWELAHGLNPNNAADAAQNPDGDGISNLQEYQSGTDPFVYDVLRIVSAQANPAGFMTFQLKVAVGKTYTLETSSNLSVWTPLNTFTCTATNQSVQVPIDSQADSWYYRLRTGTNSVGP